MVHSDAIWYDILTCREIFESNESKWCILTLVETLFWPAEKVLKAIKLNGAFCGFLRPMLDDF